MLKSWKDEVIEDQLETIRRLNDQLDERLDFEQKLMSVISKKDEEIEKLNNQLLIYVNADNQREIIDNVKAEIKTEQILDKALNTEPMIKVEQ